MELSPAGVVELVDRPDLGSGGEKPWGVQVPSPAPKYCTKHKRNIKVFHIFLKRVRNEYAN